MFQKLFPSSAKISVNKIPKIIGMIHAASLPATPGYQSSGFKGYDSGMRKILDQARKETEIFTEFEGIDGLIVENMNDTPYVKSKMLGPEIVAAMTAMSSAVRSIFPQEKPVGIQILAGANCEALAVAKVFQIFD